MIVQQDTEATGKNAASRQRESTPFALQASMSLCKMAQRKHAAEMASVP